jgi:hypothetical protein
VEPKITFEMSVNLNLYQTAWLYIPEDGIKKSRCYDKASFQQGVWHGDPTMHHSKKAAY